jgi:UDP-GlcNAc:undecaprenyl-phosphate GlcNAc-1-phosphate transferase
MNTKSNIFSSLFQEVTDSNVLYFLIILFLGVFLTSLVIIPKIRSLSLKLRFTDSSDHRSSHKGIIPSFGGVAFYISYILVLFFIQPIDSNYVSLTLLCSISLMFFTGLLDDIRDLSPKIKFLGQFISVFILMSQPDFRILSLHGFMGVQEIPLVLSVFGTMFFLLGLINAFNLIDGIDGLTGITGIIVASFYSYMFYHLGSYFYLAIGITTIATLLAFLRFNLSKKRKIFMGDTGSLVIGLVLGLLTLKLMTLKDATIPFPFNPEQLPLFLVGVLFIPVLDIMRVMALRVFKGVSIFKPDRNHIHHIIVDFGLTHSKASLFIGMVNFTVALVMFNIIQVFSSILSALILISMFLLAIIILFLMNKNNAALRLKVKLKASRFRIFFFTW